MMDARIANKSLPTNSNRVVTDTLSMEAAKGELYNDMIISKFIDIHKSFIPLGCRILHA
jgi:hypothetical protein